MDGDKPLVSHVREQDLDHTEWKVHVGGEVGHRGRETAQAQQLQVLGLELTQVAPVAADRGDHGYDVEGLATRAGPTAGERVRTDNGPGVPVKPPVISRDHVTASLCSS
jgi:hypothetical protein